MVKLPKAFWDETKLAFKVTYSKDNVARNVYTDFPDFLYGSGSAKY